MKINGKNLRKNNSRKGFTLVELIVTLAILAIVLSASIFGILAYQKYANYKRNNEYARTIFAAAQSGLTHYKASGELEDLQELLDSSGNDVNPALFSVDPEDSESKNVTGGRLVYLMIQGGNISDGYGKALYDLLEDYIYDPSVFNASICVEMDVMDGVVYAVCYSDRADSFTYAGGAGSVSGGVMNICDRTESTRKDICLGYYSSALSERAPSSYEKTSIGDVTLVNEEMLDLKFNMSNKYKALTNSLIYTVRLFDEEKNLKASFDLNNSKNIDNMLTGGDENSNRTVKTEVTFYGEDGKELSDKKKLEFRTYVDTKYVVHLTLDGLDLAAADAGMKESDSYDSTYSIRRLNLDTGRKIYVRIQASGANYKPSAWKQSNSESPYFAESDFDKSEFSVRNARHLFNIRFREEERISSTYMQKVSFAWSGEDGILNAKHVYESGKTVEWSEENVRAFPEIGILNQGSIYEGSEKKEVSIQELVLGKGVVPSEAGNGDTEEKKDIQEVVDRDDIDNKAEYSSLGLFSENSGTIRNIILENIVVDNAKIGDDETIEEESEKDGAESAAQEYGTGAVCGINYGVLENISVKGGSVTGYHNVGGIAGRDASGKSEDSGGINAGKDRKYLKLVSTASVSGEKNIGGILGYNEGSTLEECSSAPEANIENIEELAEDLKGVNVGGIVGYSLGGLLEKCGTSGGYVTGKSYVGGIVGLMESSDAKDSKVVLEGGGQKNLAIVIGEEYAGGITGANKDGTIKNWNNGGVISATKQYSGGITGYNTGIIEECISDVDTSAVSGEKQLETARKWGGTGSYAGGIAGYNGGKMISTEMRGITAIVAGENFVGGITGYNDKGASISKYKVAGGYIYGKSFVSGYAGLNASTQFFGEDRISSPNLVKGGWYTGGVIGGNLVPADKNIELRCDTDNFLGTIDADGPFTGGFIGYNAQIKAKTTKDEIAGFARKMIDSSEAESLEEGIADVVKLAQDYSHIIETGKMDIVGGRSSDSVTSGKNDVNQVKGAVYVGGIIGYSVKETKLYFSNLTNKASVIATESLQDRENSLGFGADNTYSYVGGITGITEADVFVINCTNSESGEVSGRGTYLGGLVEINNGTMMDCQAQTFGDNTRSNVGGLAGINGKTGVIQDCDVVGIITGVDRVGGLASANYGQIRGSYVDKCRFTGKVQGTGENIGGIAGVNMETGTVGGIFANGTVTGTGSNVGGLIGQNFGKFGNSIESIGGSVTGNDSVGGFIGRQSWTGETLAQLNSLENKAEVTALNGSAGGLIGVGDGSGYSMQFCDNYGKVTSVKGGNVGGIISENKVNGYLMKCNNYGVLTAGDGDVGGIAGVNEGQISHSLSTTPRDSDATVEIFGNSNVGGIAAVNKGEISNASLNNIKIYNTGGKGFIGGYAGINEGSIWTDQAMIMSADIVATTDGMSAGGLAGINRGTIEHQDKSKPKAYIQANVKTGGKNEKTIQTNLGGIAGINEGTIEDINFCGSVTGNGASDYGIGGIAGISRSGTGGRALIQNCIVGDGIGEVSVTAKGNASSFANVGGITGINYENSSISQAGLQSVSVTAEYSMGGGIAGRNYGLVTSCSLQAGSGTISFGNGNIGGLVGQNERTGELNNSIVGEGWQITAKNSSGDEAIGGCIGYNVSDMDVYGLTNKASVSKSAGSSAGGIIGRQENRTSNGWTIYNCENTGKISGNGRVGGIIGQWKYKGGTVRDCINSGNIEAKDNDSMSGGIVGTLFSIDVGQNIGISSCVNYGSITGKGQVAGIVGDSRKTDNFTANITDCINTGYIKATSKGAGIIDSSAQGKFTLLRCRNYGRSSSGSFSGIYTMSNKITSVNYCFGITDSVYPIAGGTVPSGSGNNYYFGSEGNRTGGKVEVSSIEVKGKGEQGKTAQLIDGDFSDYWKYNANSMWDGDTVDIIITFKDPVELAAADLYWHADEQKNNSTSIYTYSMEYKEDITSDYKELLPGDKYSVQKTGNGSKPVSHVFDTPVTAQVVVIHIKGAYVDDSVTSMIGMYEMEFFTGGQLQNKKVLAAGEGNEAKDKGAGTELKLEKQADGTYVAFSESSDIEIMGIPMNPNLGDYTNPEKSGEIYSGIDPILIGFYKTIFGNTKLDPPGNIQINNLGGTYEIKWDNNPKAYGAAIHVEVYDEENGSTEYAASDIYVNGQNNAYLSVPDDWIGKYMEIHVQSLSMSETPEYNSDAVKAPAAGRMYIEPVLPTPVVSIRLTNIDTINKTLSYLCVLENKEEYAAYGKCTITVASDYLSESVSISSEDEGGKAVTVSKSSLGGATNIVSAQASHQAGDEGSTRMQYSRKSNVQTQILMFSELMMEDKYVTSFDGFVGTSDGNIEYQLKLKNIVYSNNGKNLSYRAEYLEKDEKLEIPVVKGSATAYIGAGSSERIVKITNLPRLPQSLSDAGAYIRTYPWSSQSDIAKYAYYVAENISAGSLEELQNAYPAAFVDGSLGDEYVIEANQDGTYNIIFSALLRADKEGYQIKTKDLGNYGRVDQPVISEDYVYDQGDYTFSWDTESDAAGPYEVLLTGKTLDDSEVILHRNDDISDKEIILDGSSWRYKQLILQVTRKGTTTAEGVADKLSNFATKVYEVKLPLDTVGRPSAPQLDPETGKNELKYRINWNALTDEQQLQQLKGYTVYAKDETGIKLLAEVTAPDGSDTVPAEALIDLDIYEGGTKLSIYVVANVKDDSAFYKDSAAGIARDFTVPKRLDTPSAVATISPEYGPEDSPFTGITEAQFTNEGIKVTVPNGESGIKYVMTAAVYETNDVDDESGLPLGEAVYKVTSGNGQEVLAMTNAGNDASYTITGIPRDYAGKYLFICFRKTSDSAISSRWSAYQQFRLPRVQLESPQLNEGTINEILKEKQTASTGEVEKEVNVQRKVIEWVQDGIAKSYDIRFRFLGQNQTEYPVKLDYVDNGIFNVTFNEPVKKDDGTTVWELRTITMEQKDTDEEHITLYSYDLEWFSVSYSGATENGIPYSIEVPAKIQARMHWNAENGNLEYISYRILIPDMEELHGAKILKTSYVAIAASAQTEEFYTPSSWEEWVRVQTDPNDIKTNTTVFRNVDTDSKFLEIQSGENYYFMMSEYNENFQATPEVPSTEPEETEKSTESTTGGETETNNVPDTENGGQTEMNQPGTETEGTEPTEAETTVPNEEMTDGQEETQPQSETAPSEEAPLATEAAMPTEGEENTQAAETMETQEFQESSSNDGMEGTS